MTEQAATTQRHEQLVVAYRACRDALDDAGISVGTACKFELADTDGQSEAARLRQALAEAEQKLGASAASADASAAAAAAAPLTADSWAEMKRVLQDFTLGTQRDLERERADLMVRSAVAEERASKLEQFIATNLAAYQKEIKRLREALAKQPQGIQRPAPLPGLGRS